MPNNQPNQPAQENCYCHCHNKIHAMNPDKPGEDACQIQKECSHCSPQPMNEEPQKSEENQTLKPWDKENWKVASGIKYQEGETNALLATRDYGVDCNTPSENLIAIIQGYWLWWCSAHHQPYSWCNMAREKLKIKTETMNEERNRTNLAVLDHVLVFCNEKHKATCISEIQKRIFNPSLLWPLPNPRNSLVSAVKLK